MKKASLAAAFAASLTLFTLPHDGRAADDDASADGRAAEERLLGFVDEDARDRGYLTFSREIARTVVVETSLEAALAASDVPGAAMLDAMSALSTAVNLERDVHKGDRLYVRYEQEFTVEGAPIGVGHVRWAELTTRARGTVAIHRFRGRDKVDRFWLASGQAASPPALRLPLHAISISSGFGLRRDPFEQPRPLSATGRKEPMGGPPRKRGLPPGLPTGGTNGNGGTTSLGTPLGSTFAPYGNWKAAPPRAAARPLYMHEGIDLVASTGTPVYAAADGVVVGAGPNGRYGNWVRIDHPGKLSTVYGHLSAFAPGIEPGETVVRGELIAFVGSTGRSTGAHLHFELLSDGKPVNPITHPELRAAQLHGVDLERFRKQVTRSLEERASEAKVAGGAAAAAAPL
ncbi:M23 family metallopeptidase [Reyranella sp.]|uniref:M23 family metallopeptidase n=1 Tax=Reyranella sp. TaxID=1929291 RepID=UPI003BAC1B1E